MHLSDRLFTTAEMERCLGDRDSEIVFRDLAEHAEFDEQRIATLEAELRTLRADKERLDWLIRVFQFPYRAPTEGWKHDVEARFIAVADSAWGVSVDNVLRDLRAALDAAKEQTP